MTNEFWRWLKRKRACDTGMQWVRDNNIQSIQELWEKCNNISYIIWLMVKQDKNLKVLKFFLEKVSERYDFIDVGVVYSLFRYGMPQSGLCRLIEPLREKYHISYGEAKVLLLPILRKSVTCKNGKFRKFSERNVL